jgi:hypothetical protein
MGYHLGLIAALDGCSCIQAQRVGISVAFHAPTTCAASVEFADRKGYLLPQPKPRWPNGR